MLFEITSWIDKREQARQALNMAKQENNYEACKAVAWEIEFWGRVSMLESRRTQCGYTQEWLQRQIRNVLLTDERYFIDLASEESDYILIPTRIRAILNDEC